MSQDSESSMGNPSRSPVFASVAVSAFSGATLLAFLLGSHPQIATIGEMDGLIAQDDPDKYLCSCGQRIRDCEFWLSLRDAMERRGFEFDVAHFDTKFSLAGPRALQYLRHGSSRNPLLDGLRDSMLFAWPAERRALQALVVRNEAIIESVLEVTGKKVFVDTSKARLRLRSLRRLSEFEVCAIHLVRDVTGVVASRLRRGINSDARGAAQQWVRENRKIEMALQIMPRDSVLRIRYEDLCQDVEGTLDALYRFCGVDPGFTVADFRIAPHHIIGNTMRLEHASEIKLDQGWKTALTEDQLDQVRRVAHRLRARYGYS